jgi:putative hydrolase of the HAD superfamily
MRKPDREIYDYVLAENALDPENTIFLDDNEHNLKGAEQTGMAVCHITEERGLMEIFD